MTFLPIVHLLKSLKVLNGALSSALAALSATLIRDRLIPYQLGMIGSVGALFILMGLLVSLVAPARIRKRLPLFVAAACLSLLLLTLLQLYCVVTVENYGTPPAAHHFLVGYSLTEQGKEWVNGVGSGSADMAIAAVGYKRIPVMYGTSYSIAKVSYTLTYIAFVLSVVLTLGGILAPGGGTRTRESDRMESGAGASKQARGAPLSHAITKRRTRLSASRPTVLTNL